MLVKLVNKTQLIICILLANATLNVFSDSVNHETLYKSGYVWDGADFVTRDLCVIDGVFVDLSMCKSPDETINLIGKYIVQPYSDAHHHVTPSTKMASDNFLKQGIYYVLNPNTVIDGYSAEFYSKKETYDVITSMGGITAKGGHPEKLYNVSLNKWVYKNKPREYFLGNAYHILESEDQIDEILDTLVQQGAQIVKIYLLDSNSYRINTSAWGDESFYVNYGLNPEFVQTLVEAIHGRGLRVIAHVENNNDVLLALKSGVDILGHLPAHGAYNENEKSKYLLTKKIVKEMKDRGMIVIPTYLIAKPRFNSDTSPQLAAQYSTQGDNIKLLEKYKVPMLIGTDGFGSPTDELSHLKTVSGLNNTVLLNMLFTTGQYIFPERKINCFEQDCEASFLVLQSNPVKDLAALKNIALWVKQGNVNTYD